VTNSETSTPAVDLKNPLVAAVLSWLIPGAGQLYQGRTAKGLLFMTCILSTFFYGLLLGGGKVVYAAWNKNERRLPYLCQVAVGLPALPALGQAMWAERGDPLWGGLMAPPMMPGDRVPRERISQTDPVEFSDKEARYGYYQADQLSLWHKELNQRFELGTVFTMIAGLLNVLVIFDALAGPLAPEPPPRKKPEEGPVGVPPPAPA
jgi:TM2 domain-containing membrane protein YozV